MFSDSSDSPLISRLGSLLFVKQYAGRFSCTVPVPTRKALMRAFASPRDNCGIED